MSAEWEQAVNVALHQAEVAVLSLPFSGGVVRRSQLQDSILERIALLEQNVLAIHTQYDSYAPHRKQQETEANNWRQWRRLARQILDEPAAE